MHKDFSRVQRVAQELQREIATILHREVRNPRVGRVSVTSVELSRDLSLAKVFVTFDDAERMHRVEDGLRGLRDAKRFIRGRLGFALQLRVVPDLHFYNDESIQNGCKMDELISQAMKKSGGGSSEERDLQ